MVDHSNSHNSPPRHSQPLLPTPSPLPPCCHNRLPMLSSAFDCVAAVYLHCWPEVRIFHQLRDLARIHLAAHEGIACFLPLKGSQSQRAHVPFVLLRCCSRAGPPACQPWGAAWRRRSADRSSSHSRYPRILERREVESRGSGPRPATRPSLLASGLQPCAPVRSLPGRQQTCPLAPVTCGPTTSG